MMRLNPEEELSKSVLKTMKELEAVLDHNQVDIDYDILIPIQKELLRQMSLVFKKEWKRVKQGEPFYLFIKYFIVPIVILVSLLGILKPKLSSVIHPISSTVTK